MKQVADVVRMISENKHWEEITNVNRAKCVCIHEDCMCGLSVMVNKTACPCECEGMCPGL